MADLLAYRARHPNTGPRLAKAAANLAAWLGPATEWNSDMLEGIALTLDAGTGDLPDLGCTEAWQELTAADATPDLIKPPSPERYLVTWVVDIDDTFGSVEDVARHALDMITRPSSTAHVFTVHDNQTCTTTVVDLDDPDNTTVLEG